MSAEDDGEVGSRGEADDADVGGVDVPLGRVVRVRRMACWASSRSSVLAG